MHTSMMIIELCTVCAYMTALQNLKCAINHYEAYQLHLENVIPSLIFGF